MTVDATRVRSLNSRPIEDGDYVLYWMQAAQRVHGNDALALAAEQANALRCPLVVAFGLVGRYLGAGQRQYRFMLEGLCQVARQLDDRGIAFVMRQASPEHLAFDLGQRARLVVVDRGYLRHQKRWYAYLAKRLACALIQVETNVVVPVEVASPKEEYAARTLRPRIRRHLDRYLRLADVPDVTHSPRALVLDTMHALDPEAALRSLGMPPCPPTPRAELRGGEAHARRLLAEFVETKLERYDQQRNDPGLSVNALSQMSPYLHFGQISPVEVAMRVGETRLPAVAVYLEELVVRRELAINMAHYNPHYDTLAVLPRWAQATLADHAGDPRPIVYPLSALEAGLTHDPYWNAAQREMVLTGKMHGYMRMYWGKKILEWSPDPAAALARILYLNDAYELDGRDPNGYAGAAWCLGKHDQAWAERPIFGKVRYMNARGLERKFDIQEYVRRVATLDLATTTPARVA